VSGDEEKIRRHVVRNVIDNSIKYTQEGSVDVEVTRANGIARVTVRDTGVGISREDMAHLFTEGGHGKESIKINVHSTGYGLFIAKTIVEAHKGKIWAESDGPGKGSRFIIELPLAL
jgi:signal transduction histidine kinase